MPTGIFPPTHRPKGLLRSCLLVLVAPPQPHHCSPASRHMHMLGAQKGLGESPSFQGSECYALLASLYAWTGNTLGFSLTL